MVDNKQSNSVRVLLRCSDDECPWRAKFVRRIEVGVPGFRCDWDGTILQHSEMCVITFHSRGLSPQAIAALPSFQSVVHGCHKSPTKVLSKAVDEQLSLRIPDSTLQRSRNLVLGNKLELAAEELLDIGAVLAAYERLNPGAVVGLDVDASNELVHWFVSFENSGIIQGLLPLVFCDGAHIKNTVCRRFILAISALNTARQLVILAIACVKSESTESWTYMFNMFSRTALGQLALLGRVVLVSDRDGGLRAAARHVFPLALVRFCIVHIIKNAKQARIRGNFRLLVRIAKAGSPFDRDRLMAELKRTSPALVTWLSNSSMSENQWQSASGFAFFGCVTSNAAESANSKLLRPAHAIQSLREMTPGPMLREAMNIFSSQATQFRARSLNLSMSHLAFTKPAVQLFMKQQVESRSYVVFERGLFDYLVSRAGKTVAA